MKRKIKDFSKSLLRKGFEVLQTCGINVLPSHYYSQIPFIKELKRDEYWKRPYSMSFINGYDTVTQMNFVRQQINKNTIVTPLSTIYEKAVSKNGEDGGFGFIEAQFLYCFIIKNKPSKIIQIGCGVSTAVILNACEDSGHIPELICIDPYPMPYLHDLAEKEKSD